MISAKNIFIVAAWKHKLWLYSNAIKYLIIRIYCCKKKAVVCYGSAGDIFRIIQHIKIFEIENPDIVIIGSINYKEVFRIFGLSDHRLLSLSEDWCTAIFNHSFYSKKSLNMSNGKFLNLNVNVDEKLRKLIINSDLPMKEALLKIAPICNLDLIKKSYPRYSNNDRQIVKDILSPFWDSKDRIILVNPIGYTHNSITRINWEVIASVLECAGYKVVFNVTNNVTRPKHDEWFNCPNAIQVPVHLLPLLSDKVRLSLARPGGAFDLSFGYSRYSDVLILFFKNKKIYSQQLSCCNEIHMKQLLTADFGRSVNCIEIDENFSPKLVGNEILQYLSNGECRGV